MLLAYHPFCPLLLPLDIKLYCWLMFDSDGLKIVNRCYITTHSHLLYYV